MTTKNKYEFYLDGKKYQKEYLRAIKQAKKSICLQTYIFKLDSFGTKVYDTLILKAKEGIKIDLTIDHIGSYHFDHQLRKRLIGTKKFKIHFFNPICLPKILRLGRRLHQKILIIDQTIAIIGGINVVSGVDSSFDKYPRLDFAIKIENKEIKDLYKYCLQISQTLSNSNKTNSLPEISTKKCSILFLYNDWLNNRKQITSRYLELIKNSTDSIFLVHGYFFPSFKIIQSLISKSKQGVKIVLILPKYSDWPSWIWASEYLYPKLIKSGIEIREWDRSELHGKLAIFDKRILLVGSYNLNYTSSYGNLEMNIELNHQPFVLNVIKVQLKYVLEGSKKIRLDIFLKRSIKERILSAISYYILLLIATISINLFKMNRH